MKTANKISILVLATISLFCGCGDDRSAEYYEMTKENQWIYNKMKEVYLWRDSIGEVEQNTFFNDNSKFFTELLYQDDKVSFFGDDDEEETTYGMTFSLMRDPLGIAPAKVYALVEFVEPASAAAYAGVERGMYISSINGSSLTMSSGSTLKTGNSKILGVHKIVFDDEINDYQWEEQNDITLPIATEFATTPLPVIKTINEAGSTTGYILCNDFDTEEAVKDLQNALSSFVADNVNNIILDLRYNSSLSLDNAAQIAASLVPTDKAGATFCMLYRDSETNEKTEITIPSSIIDASDKWLYIITTEQTQTAANALVQAVRQTRGTTSMRVIGEAAANSNLFTERIESPYGFSINPATAIIYTAADEWLAPLTPDFEISEFNDYRSVYPLGDKQEYILYNINHIIATGTLPD